jgi:hypothetical protein
MKYIYKHDDSNNVTITDYEPDNVITVIFDGVEAYYASVNCVASGSYELLATYEGRFFEGDQLTIYLPVGIGKGGKYYFGSPTNDNAKRIIFPANIKPQVRYGKTYYIQMYLYNEDPNVAYYAEMEALALPQAGNEYGVGLGQCNGYKTFIDHDDLASSGMCVLLDKDSYVWTEPIAEGGTYQVTVYCESNCLSYVDEPFALGYRDVDGSQYLYAGLSVPDMDVYEAKKVVVEGVSIPAGASLIVMNPNESINALINLDDIKLVKTGDFAEPIAVGIEDIKDFKELKNSKDTIYNLAGQKVNGNLSSGKLPRGIYIKNGKKILVK